MLPKAVSSPQKAERERGVKMKVELYLLDKGILLDKEDKEYNMYSVAYDKQNAYYDTYQELFAKESFEVVKGIVKQEVMRYKSYYAVITNQGFWNLDEEDLKDLSNCDLVECDYSKENVIYSIMSDKFGNITLSFTDTTKTNRSTWALKVKAKRIMNFIV
jgi:hypothetical protein